MTTNSRHGSESGFALPSVLMLITILSLVSFSIIALQYMQHRLAQMQIAAVKAEYAAQSGIVKSLTTPSSSELFSFNDGSEARIVLKRAWGMFTLVVSEGRFQRAGATRIALAGARLTDVYRSALLFGNISHQLVFTGSASVKGDVVVGQPGVSTGTMRDYPTPTRMPIEGKVTKEIAPALPDPGDVSREFLASYYDECFRVSQSRTSLQCNVIHPGVGSEGTFDCSSIDDSTDYILLDGNVILEGKVTRRTRPVNIVIDGNATVRSSAVFDGLVFIGAAGEVTIPEGAGIRNCLVASRTSIHLLQSAKVTGQFISPKVTIDSNVVAGYPSLIMSLPPSKSGGKIREIVLKGNAKVEGWVILYSTPAVSQPDDIVTLGPQAIVTGLVRSDNVAAIDGSVAGIVHTKDFFFYKSPTRYYGWLKSGRIDRSTLPEGFLVPPILAPAPEYEVLEWL